MDIHFFISNIVFNNQIYNAFPILENIFMLMIKITKGIEIANILHISSHLVQTCFWPSYIYINGMQIMDKLYGGYKVN